MIIYSEKLTKHDISDFELSGNIYDQEEIKERELSCLPPFV